MKPCALLGRSLVAVWLGLAVSNVEAEALHTYVSATGNDANTCDVPATPCRTFMGAIAQTAEWGDVTVLDSGTFGGGTISKPVSVTAPPGVTALVATPITVNVLNSQRVSLHGITFVSPSPRTGTAVTFSSGLSLVIEHCTFHGWSRAVYVTADDYARLVVVDSTVRDSVYGFSFSNQLRTGDSQPTEASIERTQILGNTYGVYAGGTGGGRFAVNDSVVEGNEYGLVAMSNGSSPVELSIANSMISKNGYGVLATQGISYGKIRIFNSIVTNNAHGLVQKDLGVLLSLGDNTVEGNGSDIEGTVGSFSKK
jgi:hypothetical protein